MALRSQPRVLTGPPVQLTSGLTLHQCVSDLRAGIRREANPARESAPRPQMASSGGYRAVSSPRVGVSRWVTHFFGRNTFTRLLDEGRCGAVRATLALWSLPASSAPYCMLMPIFPSAVDSAGRLLTDVAAPADARRFIDQYSGTVKSHFFGSDTYTRLLDEGRCEAVRATLALDDALAPQLLLSDAAEKEPRVYEDESAVCPTICPQHEES